MYGQLLVLIILIGLSGFFSASETALTAFKGTDLDKIKEPKKLELLKKWMKNPNEMLTGMLLGNNIVNISTSSIATALTFAILGNNGSAIAIATALTTIIILIFGEITPKVIARSSSAKVAGTVIIPIYFLTLIATPIIKILMLTSRIVSSLFGIQLKNENLMVTQKDIISYINMGEVEGVIEREEKSMLHSVFELGGTRAREVMTPRISMFAISSEKTLEEIWDEIKERGFSRIPVYSNNGIDDIIGILYLKDLMDIVKSKKMNTRVGEIARDPYFIPENKPIMEILKEFKTRRVHIAIVLDEYGGTSGVLTIEDLIEEIVGEIQDEHDNIDIDPIRKVEDGHYEVDATLNIDTLNREIHTNLPTSNTYDTLGGFIEEELKKVANIGDSIYISNIQISVIEMDKIRISKVSIKKII